EVGTFTSGLDGSLSFTAGIQAPTIATQPSSQTVECGSGVTFTVAATGSQPFTYQWRFNNLDIGGATGSSYFIGNVSPANAGSYTAAVSNGGGPTLSAAGVLTVLDAAGPIPSPNS